MATIVDKDARAFRLQDIDPDLRRDPRYAEAARDPDATIPQLTMLAFEVYRERPAMAWRAVHSGLLDDDYTIIDYAELERRVLGAAAALAHDPALGLSPGDPVAIMAFANVDFATLNLTLGLLGLPIVPLQTTASVEALEGMIGEVRAPVIATALEHLETAVTLVLGCPQTRAVVVFDHDGFDDTECAQVAAQKARLAKDRPDVVMMTFSEMRARGAALPPATPYQPQPGEDPLVVVYYTSGSTGTPKGAMHTQRLAKAGWLNTREISPVVLSYQPLNHVYGMVYLWLTFASGGITCFTGRSDLSTLMEDIAAVRPTTMALVPRICELIHQRFTAQFPDLADETALDEALAAFNDRALGGRIADAVVGSAPLDPGLRTFIERLFGRPIVDGYGSTESGSITLDQKVTRPPIVDYKLIDVPELGYFTTDKPHPRGELLIKSVALFAGYFGRPDLSAAAFDDDGYFRTGDIMAELEPDRLAYLDRRNNVVKLAQGEFVAIAPLEALFTLGDPAISQVYLYANSARAYLLGVVVPDPAALPPGLGEAEVKEHLLAALRRIGLEAGLNAYEIPRDIIVENEPFSVANGLQSALAKHLRPALKARYGDRLEAMYATHADDQAIELDELRRHGRDRPMSETLRRAAASILGIQAAEVSDDTSFAALGGDSLAGLSYALLLEDIYGFPVDVGTIMHPAGSFVQLARDIERQRGGEGEGGVGAADVHGPDAAVIRAADLTLDKFIPREVLADAAAIAPASTGEPRCVLLTGANGFLGRFLALSWLRRLAKVDGRLICLARGADAAAARERLLRSFAGGDDALARDIDALAEGRLEVLAGDLAAPRLGLEGADWSRLAADVDAIVHPAALVNHVLPYAQLFRPNVAGTASLIELALTTRAKRIIHVSTVAAAFHDGRVAAENDDVRAAIPQWRASSGYADGYGASKWAAEVLLREANEHFGLPVSVFRSGMIMAPAGYSGHLNLPDIFTRQILSLAATRLAPDSFYEGERAHYDGLPVDFIADAVAAIGAGQDSGFATFHVLNPHDDAVSLDTFVDWLEELGYSMTRASFAQWRDRFEGALRALPDEVRQASMLPLLEAVARPQPANPGSTLPCPRFVEATARAGVTDDGQVPHLGAALIGRYVTDLKAQGLLS
ncbi:carboxylic acid reductase [Sphingopyxis flava]|uniref:Fatty acid CoA ligase FadD9 n=1 Tax=Sphingopyxis flava TaxID=1507287 RepID=A0A1T5FEL0_9SPHN|nr:carboxylic acid reductase [Sphingopyxis flava]SKB94619.1 fatty acid CoA ligase FadD9 [Sphingopyxis flava]